MPTEQTLELLSELERLHEVEGERIPVKDAVVLLAKKGIYVPSPDSRYGQETNRTAVRLLSEEGNPNRGNFSFKVLKDFLRSVDNYQGRGLDSIRGRFRYFGFKGKAGYLTERIRKTEMRDPKFISQEDPNLILKSYARGLGEVPLFIEVIRQMPRFENGTFGLFMVRGEGNYFNQNVSAFYDAVFGRENRLI